MKPLTLIILILVLIGGVASIYLAALSFFPKTSVREISFAPREAPPSAQKATEYPAPDFTLFDVEGNKVKLANFENKAILLVFWTSWNPAAQDQIAILESYFQEIKNNPDIVLLTVNNLEDRSVVTNFLRRGDYILPVLQDQDGKIGELYQINTLPAFFFINGQGKIKGVFIGVLNAEEIKARVEKLFL